MNAGTMLSNLTIGPLKMLFEFIFSLAYRVLSPGGSIVLLSLCVNLLVLPLYRRADRIQKETRDTEARLGPDIQHIKTTFQGDEQFFMLQSYYRRNHYSPLNTLKSALPLMLQVPFFIAAYQFLSHLGSLQGAPFGPVSNLGQPDGLLRIDGLSLNLLPILMTAINLLSGALYTREEPLKEKLQLLGMALIFLALLYQSPAGLTLYWTLNNIFSLLKSLLSKRRKQKPTSRRASPKALRGTTSFRFFLFSMLALTVLTGLLIPSEVLAASPQEFLETMSDLHPLWYMANAFLLASGTFLLWCTIYYALASGPVRKAMEIGGWVLSGLSLINYLCFHDNLGTISSELVYHITPVFTTAQKLVNLGVLIAAALMLGFLCVRKEHLTRSLALILIITLCGMSSRNVWTVTREVNSARRVMERNFSGEEEIPLSLEGKNVVILFLDRAISSYLPCILYEKPELKEIYSGFVYYPNTLSHGAHTNMGAPGLFGGYEYTPWAMNARDTLSLREKHNEALLLMPTLFSQEDYRVSVFDVPYPGDYSEAGDYSLFDLLLNTNARKLEGAVENTTGNAVKEAVRLRNFFCYSLCMVTPTALYGALYDFGDYLQPEGSSFLFTGRAGVQRDIYLDAELSFLSPYEVLKKLGQMTTLRKTGDTFLLLRNNTTHSPVLLQEPDYIPGDTSENETYDEIHQERFKAGPFPIEEDIYGMMHYDVNMAALLKIGEWLEQLKEWGVYDNTRIIIVSDHGGNDLFQIEEGVLDKTATDICGLNPLLMVKDFDAEGEIYTDTAFMTNADVPSLALEGLVENPVNPFTGNLISTSEKNNPQYVNVSHLYDVKTNHGNRFLPGLWYMVQPGGETLFDLSRWTYLGDTPQ